MPIRSALEIPKTKSRLRWAANLRVGIDLEEVAGLSSSSANAVLTGAAATGTLASLTSKMLDAGTIEGLDFSQTQKVKSRYALGPNPLVAFQTVQQQISYTLTLQRVVLKRIPEVEAVFNFLPSNLVLQQYPFIIELTDVGDGTAETEIKHFLFGCRFTESKVRYEAIKGTDSRLIQNASIAVGRVLTFDQSNAGNPAVQFASGLIGSALSTGAGQQLLSNFSLI